MTYYISNDYLAHHGVKGMHWGIRRYQNADGSLKKAGQLRYGDPRVARAKEAMRTANKNYNAAYKDAYRFSSRHPISQHIKSSKNYEKSNELWYKTYDTAKTADNAKKAYKNAKNKSKTEAVKKYTKAYDEASNMSDQSDAMFRKAAEQRKALAKTKIGRFKEVVKATRGNGSAAANEYLKTFDKASELGDKASDLWQKSDTLYHQTGKTYVARVINNMKYSKKK